MVSELFRAFQRFSEGLRGFQRFSEVFGGFERFSEVFQRPSQRPSQSAIFLSELRVVLPLIVLPLKTPAKPGRPPESKPNRPEIGPEWGLGASTGNPP